MAAQAQLVLEKQANNFRYADWQGAVQAHGPAGVITETLRAAAGANTEPFFVSCDSEWKIGDIQTLLLQYGIKLWGVGYWNNELFFRVKGRQAHWAQYVLLRAGVPLCHGLLSGSRAIPGYSRQAAPNATDHGSLTDRVRDWIGWLINP